MAMVTMVTTMWGHLKAIGKTREIGGFTMKKWWFMRFIVDIGWLNWDNFTFGFMVAIMN